MKRRGFSEVFRCAGGIIITSLLVVCATAEGYAHIAVSTKSLNSLVVESDAVIRARVVEFDEVVALDGTDVLHRPVWRVDVLEVLKGPVISGNELQFAQHGHGVAAYAPGDEALFFLRDLSRSSELGRLGATGAVKWYSTQEHDDDYVLPPESRRATLEAVRAYAAIEKMPDDKKTAALHRLTLKLLASRDLRLATSALRDLALAGGAPLVTERDIPALTKVIRDTRSSIGVRVSLLSELERRGLLESDPHWVRLLRVTKGPDRLVVIRAAGAHASSRVNAELAKILEGPDDSAASTAAVSMGSVGNTSAVEPLSRALLSEHTRVAMAAIRGLGGIGTADARAAIASAAESHPDASVRRRAQAELRLLEPHRGGSR